MHQHELVLEPVRAGKGVVLHARGDGVAVGPVVNHVHAVGRRALLLDQAPLHPIAERDNRVGLADQPPVDPIQRAIDGRVMKIFEQRRDFRKDVFAQKDKPRTGPPRRPERGQAENRRIGQRDDDVLRADFPRRGDRRSKICQVVCGAPCELAPSEQGAVRAQDVDAFMLFARHRPSASASASGPRCGRQIPACRARPATTDTWQP